MYLEHFGLGVNPFSLSPKLDFLYKSGTFEESMAHLVYGLDNHEAIVLITGPIGTGKTMALQSFLTNLGPRFEFALVTNTRVTSIELLKLILEDLHVKWPFGADKSDLLILFKEFLHEANQAGKMVLIVVDEAQNLAPEVLEEIRLLTNLGQGEAQPVQIILVGQPELEDTVNRPDLAQIRQRIRVHYTLDPLSRKETEEYLDHRMAVAGCSRQVFTSGAVDRIFRSSHGVPRLVNTMAGDALLSAFVAGHQMVQPVDVEEDQDLRFAKGPAPAAAPAPQVQVAPPAEPPLTPPPTRELPPPPPPAPRPAPEVLLRRRPRGGMGRIVLPWVMAAVLVLALVALYSFGFLDGVVNAVSSRSKEVAESPVTPESALVHQESTSDLAVKTTPAEDSPPAVEVVDQEPQQPKVVTEAPIEKAKASVPVPAAPVETVPADAAYYVHVYSFRTPERAESYIRRWNHPGHNIVTRVQEVRGEDWYRIYLGPFPTKELALMEALRLQQDGTISYYKVLQLPDNQGS